MSQALKTLLGNSHPLFLANMSSLEKSSGNSGIDTRLIADVAERAHRVMRTLGLDAVDTTAPELYAALQSLSEEEIKTRQLLHDCHYTLLAIGGEVVSFNYIDVIENYHHQLEYTDRQTNKAVQSLRLEIVRLYAEHERTHEPAVHQSATDIGLLRGDEHHLIHAEPLVIAPREETLTTVSHSDDAQPIMLSIGDIFTDAFIKLREDKARIDTDPDGSQRLSLPFGSKPPYERVDIVQAVGPSPNAAVSFARLGLQSRLMAFLGDDKPGKDSLDYLASESVSSDDISVQSGIASNYYYVLRYGADRTILVKNEAYHYDWSEPKVTPDWVYLSLISEDSWQLHLDLLQYLADRPSIKLAFQPGTFHFEWGASKLADIYKRSHIVVMNREEAVDVTGRSYDSLHDLFDGLHQLGPKIAVITDGPHGSYASYNEKVVQINNYPDPGPPLDRTGAGDAFASTIVAALALGKSMDEALMWAPINSMNVVQHLGAQAGLLTQEKIREYTHDAPADFVVTPLPLDEQYMTEEEE